MKKRPRSESSLDDKDADVTESLTKTKQAPAYGSKEYWETRYERSSADSNDQISSNNNHEEGDGGEQPEAFHAWYFSYEELSPILLPLILGEGEMEEDDVKDAPDEGINVKATDDSKQDSTTLNDPKEEEEESLQEEENSIEEKEAESKERDDEEFLEFEELEEEEEEEEEEEGEESSNRIGLAKDGPISVLEVGCGDVPLGRDLLLGIQQLESMTGVEAINILKRVICIDYSKNVIEKMKKQWEEDTKGVTRPPSVPLKYEIGDARKLSYPASNFELILEKGTMDAMLSDSDVGSENCRLIVAECARLLTIGGSLVIVSHLNAHVHSGLQWLDRIVVPGLRKECGENKWEIEVHGNAPEDPPPEDEKEEASPGPAVYIIHKGEKVMANEGSSETESQFPGVRLRFFSY